MEQSQSQIQTTSAILQLRPFIVANLTWETADVFTLTLRPESSESFFSFAAGQWVYLHLLKENGESLIRAAFTIASAPSESNEHLELGIKLNGALSKKAAELAPGVRVALQGPFGVFTLHPEISPQVIFAAGIGITPFRSMIRELAFRKAGTEVTLFYSNKRAETIAYYKEFQRLAETWPAFHPIYTLTEAAPPAWKGEIGRINDQLLKKYVKDFSIGEFLMCGPKDFMSAIRTLLSNQGVDTKKRLRSESFG
ncbi:MAG TPA: FAD-dependent oxidoreductase [Patescibacteria group bacterium]|nr:FAD-dependent oxidoreductase [Patescibacteria group bacterium]